MLEAYGYFTPKAPLAERIFESPRGLEALLRKPFKRKPREDARFGRRGEGFSGAAKPRP